MSQTQQIDGRNFNTGSVLATLGNVVSSSRQAAQKEAENKATGSFFDNLLNATQARQNAQQDTQTDVYEKRANEGTQRDKTPARVWKDDASEEREAQDAIEKEDDHQQPIQKKADKDETASEQKEAQQNEKTGTEGAEQKAASSVPAEKEKDTSVEAKEKTDTEKAPDVVEAAFAFLQQFFAAPALPAATTPETAVEEALTPASEVLPTKETLAEGVEDALSAEKTETQGFWNKLPAKEDLADQTQLLSLFAETLETTELPSGVKAKLERALSDDGKKTEVMPTLLANAQPTDEEVALTQTGEKEPGDVKGGENKNTAIDLTKNLSPVSVTTDDVVENAPQQKEAVEKPFLEEGAKIFVSKAKEPAVAEKVAAEAGQPLAQIMTEEEGQDTAAFQDNTQERPQNSSRTTPASALARSEQALSQAAVSPAAVENGASQAGAQDKANTTVFAVKVANALEALRHVESGGRESQPQATLNANLAAKNAALDLANQMAAMKTMPSHVGNHLQTVVDQVSQAMARMAKSGDDQVTLRLNPAELGRVDVKLEFGADKQIRGTVMVSNQETLDLLKQDQRQLQTALQDAGYQTDGGSLQFSLRDDGGADQSQQGQASRSGAKGDDFEKVVAGTQETSVPEEQYYVTRERVNLKV